MTAKSNSGDPSSTGLPPIKTATAEQTRAAKGAKQAVTMPAITLKTSGVTVPLDEPVADNGATTTVNVPATVPTYGSGAMLPAGGRGGPPGGLAPTAISPPPQRPPFWVRFRWPILGVAGAIAAAALVLLVINLTEGPAKKIMDAAADEVNSLNETVDDADSLSDFREVASDARSARTKVGELQVDAREISAEDERGAVVAMLEGQAKLLDTYVALNQIRRNNLDPVDSILDDAEDAQAAISTAFDQLGPLEIDPATDKTVLEGAVDNLDDRLTNAESKMKSWAKRNRLMKRKRAAFDVHAGQLSSARVSLFQQRDEVETFVNRPGIDVYSSGGTEIDRLEAARQSLLSNVQGMSLNPLLAGAHQDLLEALRISVGAFADLRTAWGSQSIDESINEASGYGAYRATTPRVTSLYQSSGAKLDSARVTARARYKRPAMPEL